MTPPLPPTTNAGLGRFSATTIALVLGVLTLLIALLTPEPPGRSEGGLSTYSTAPGGAKMVYELASRLAWRTERRITTLAAHADTQPAVQVVLDPREPLGAHEIHNLLENVRRGGGLVFSVDGDQGLADSLGMAPGYRPQFFSLIGTPGTTDSVAAEDSACVPQNRRVVMTADALTLPPEVREITWKRHAPGLVEPLVYSGGAANGEMVAGLGFALGKGRVAVAGGSDVFSNAAVRVCRWGADVAVMKLIESVRPPNDSNPTLVFDEFHHGFGVHGGSLKAAATYLWQTRSGNLLLQALVAGLLLLFAMAPRPLVPREDTHVVRRSPLEHASALGRAYEDVGATRTATSNLIGGLRRRTRGIVPVPASADDSDFLAAVVRRIPSLAPRVNAVDSARTTETSKADFAEVGHALATIEEQLQSTPSTRS